MLERNDAFERQAEEVLLDAVDVWTESEEDDEDPSSFIDLRAADV